MTTKKSEGRKLARKFESTTEWAEIRALSKLSLERPLSSSEYFRFKTLCKKHGVHAGGWPH